MNIKRIGRNIVVLMRFWDRASQKDANCQSHSKIIWRKSEKIIFLFLWSLFEFVFVWKRSCIYELQINIGLGLYLQLILCCYNRNSYSNWIFIAFIILCQNFTDSLNLVLLHTDLMIKSTIFFNLSKTLTFIPWTFNEGKVPLVQWALRSHI